MEGCVFDLSLQSVASTTSALANKSPVAPGVSDSMKFPEMKNLTFSSRNRNAFAAFAGSTLLILIIGFSAVLGFWYPSDSIDSNETASQKIESVPPDGTIGHYYPDVIENPEFQELQLIRAQLRVELRTIRTYLENSDVPRYLSLEEVAPLGKATELRFHYFGVEQYSDAIGASLRSEIMSSFPTLTESDVSNEKYDESSNMINISIAMTTFDLDRLIREYRALEQNVEHEPNRFKPSDEPE